VIADQWLQVDSEQGFSLHSTVEFGCSPIDPQNYLTYVSNTAFHLYSLVGSVYR